MPKISAVEDVWFGSRNRKAPSAARGRECVGGRGCVCAHDHALAIRPLVGGGEAYRTHLLLAFFIWPSTKHSFRDGALFLIITQTLPTFGRSLRFSMHYTKASTLCVFIVVTYLSHS